ncbi:unnamed protein product [Ilex paraguariensis]|uniref:Uncharacterized protein n=1 Tax=Ilex paraguariensis TaxID=185542 RepID=A0ABC8UPL5_9AQUA
MEVTYKSIEESLAALLARSTESRHRESTERKTQAVVDRRKGAETPSKGSLGGLEVWERFWAKCPKGPKISIDRVGLFKILRV